MNNPAYQSAFETLLNSWRATFAAEVNAALMGGVASVMTPSKPRAANGHVVKANGAQPSTPRKAMRTKGEKRSATELDALTVQLRAYIARNPGQRIEQIGKAMGVATKDLSLPVKKLIANGKLKTRGQKRATAYFVKS